MQQHHHNHHYSPPPQVSYQDSSDIKQGKTDNPHAATTLALCAVYCNHRSR